MHYNTLSGVASTVYPKSQEQVENILKRLRYRYIPADLIDAETKERIGGVEQVDGGKRRKWVWWFDADKVTDALQHSIP